MIIKIQDKIKAEEAVSLALNLMAERRKKYGDSWEQAKEYRLLAMIVEKADRLEMNYLSKNIDYENKKDTLIDIINWSLFYLQNLEDEKYDV